MSHQCKDDSCNMGMGSHSCCGSSGNCCGSSGNCCCCSGQGKSCCCSGASTCEGKEDHAKKLLALADMAWMEVLKEEMKEIIRSQNNKIADLARIVCEANKARWEQKMSAKKCCSDYEEKLKKLMCCCDQSCSSSSNSKQGNGNGTKNGRSG